MIPFSLALSLSLSLSLVCSFQRSYVMLRITTVAIVMIDVNVSQAKCMRGHLINAPNDDVVE